MLHKFVSVSPVMSELREGGLWVHDGRRLDGFHVDLSHLSSSPPVCDAVSHRTSSIRIQSMWVSHLQPWGNAESMSVEWKVKPGASVAVGLRCLGECRPVTWVTEGLALGWNRVTTVAVCGLTSEAWLLPFDFCMLILTLYCMNYYLNLICFNVFLLLNIAQIYWKWKYLKKM